MQNVGVVYPPWFSPERFRGAVAAAEDDGIPELWLWEDAFSQSGLATAVAALGWTERLTVGVGLMPVPFRNVVLLAMEIASIERMFPDRFRPAVGHGVQEWMGQVGARVDSPLTLMKEYLTALRALLSGETLTMDGRYLHIDAVTLRWPSPNPPVVMAGATGEKTLESFGALADTVLVDSDTSPSELRRLIEVVRRGAERAGRADFARIDLYAIAVRGADARERLSITSGEMPDDPDLQPVAFGSGEEVAAAITRWRQAGASTVILRPPEDDPDIEGFIHFVGQDVAAHL